nr:MAG TPA: hypothetical protein [Caudoviricetes sp.]
MVLQHIYYVKLQSLLLSLTINPRLYHYLTLS